MVLHLSDDTVAAHIAHLCVCLRAHLIHLDGGIDHLLAGHHTLGVDASLGALGQRHDISALVAACHHVIISSAGDLVRTRRSEAHDWRHLLVVSINDALGQFMVADSVEV